MRQTTEGVVLLQEHEARTRLFDAEATGRFGDERAHAQVDGGGAVSDVEDGAVVRVAFAQLNTTKNLRFRGAGQGRDLSVGPQGEHGGRGGGIRPAVRLHDGTGEVEVMSKTIVLGGMVERDERAVTSQVDGGPPRRIAGGIAHGGLQLRAAGDVDRAADDARGAAEAQGEHTGADGGGAGVGLGGGIENQLTSARLREASCARQHGLHRGGLARCDGDGRRRAREREGLRGERHARGIVDAVERRGRSQRYRLHRTAGEVSDVGVGEGVGRGGRGAWDRRPGAGVHPERAVERGRARGAGAGGRAVLVEEDVGGARTRRRTHGEESGGGEEARAGDELRGTTAFHLSKDWG